MQAGASRLTASILRQSFFVGMCETQADRVESRVNRIPLRPAPR
jgi:hypothetical protein